MATYPELHALTSDTAFMERVTVATAIAAQGINIEDADTPYHDRRKRWAAQVLQSPVQAAQAMVWAILAQYKDLTPAQITGATDSDLQDAVDATVSLFVER